MDRAANEPWTSVRTDDRRQFRDEHLLRVERRLQQVSQDLGLRPSVGMHDRYARRRISHAFPCERDNAVYCPSLGAWPLDHADLAVGELKYRFDV